MAGFDDPAFYGDRWAAVYDDHYGHVDPGRAVEFLAGLARDGRVLELAIGTGRVALPLAARGISVQGVDASAAMVERLRAKPGGESVPVTIGDMAEVPVSGRFRLVYLIFNTLFGLLSQERQAECFGNVTRVLEPGGTFVIECFVPDRPDGRPGWPAASRALRRLGPAALHLGQQQPRIGVPASLRSARRTRITWPRPYLGGWSTLCTDAGACLGACHCSADEYRQFPPSSQ